jgi:hypothetical protein
VKRILCTVGALALVTGAAACGSTTTTAHPTVAASGVSGAETIRGTITGAKAAKDLASNSSAPLKFPAFVFTGLVATRTGKLTLGGQKAGKHTFVTPAGNLVVSHSSGTKGQGSPVWHRAGKLCYFQQVATKGTYSAIGGTGKFAGAKGTGAFSLTIAATMPLLSGKSKCSARNTGNPEASGASIVFLAAGTLAVK